MQVGIIWRRTQRVNGGGVCVQTLALPGPAPSKRLKPGGWTAWLDPKG